MAFCELVEGDCGGPSSLIHLTSHFVHDHGFKEEEIHPLFGHKKRFQRIDRDSLVKEFLEEIASCPQTFRMDNLLQEMREIDHNIHPPIAAPGVAQELTGLDTAWANQYLQSGRHFNENHADDIWHPNIQQHSNATQQTHELGLGPKWAEEYIEHSIDVLQTGINEKNTTETIENDNGKVVYSKFMKFMKQEGEEDLAVAGDCTDEFQKDNASSEADANDSAFLRLQKEWGKISAQEVSTKHPWLSEYDIYYDPFKEYEFHEENPMKGVPNPLEEGKKRLEAGDLPSAILCFEAAVKQNQNDPEAWLLLGKTQAENVQDPLAISALKRCLTIDPMNGAALMALAVSYTNESYKNQACLILKEWLLKNEKYKHLATKTCHIEQDSRQDGSSISFVEELEDVKNLYIQAARINPRNEIDPDVQYGLGVLFNLSYEYDKACHCFAAALQVRTNDSRLWNRLGDTLANGEKVLDASSAYYWALKLSPRFIRARYNMGITLMKIGNHGLAAKHFLTALNHQAAGRGTQGENFSPKATSNTIWLTLRRAFSSMYGFHDQIDAVDSRDLARLNKDFERMGYFVDATC